MRLRFPELDKNIGAMVRSLRVQNGLSRQQVGNKLGISHQQIAKYESGNGRISAAGLFNLCNILNTPISDIFDGAMKGAQEVTNPDRLTIEFARAFSKIKDKNVREKIKWLIDSLSEKA